MRRILVVTGTRAEFGLLKPLIEKIDEHEHLQLQLLATAMHLSPEFGNTIQEIEQAGYKADKKVECLLSSDTAVGVTKSMGLAMIGFADAVEELAPDVVVILGDRSEMLAAASASLIANVPVAHIHGGETTEGAYDEGIRHAITKMSYWHFASTETYRKRIIQMGENPARVHKVGAIGLDSINNLDLLSRKEFEKSIGFELGARTLLITFHPVTLEKDSSAEQFQAILDTVDTLCDTKLVFTHANSDKNGRIINQMIEKFVNNHQETSVAFQSLGQLRYLSALQYVDAVVGNSSSGIVEVPYFNIPTINIGERQKGRVRAESVIEAEPNVESLKTALDLAFNSSFQQRVRNQEQIYGTGESVDKIIHILANEPFDSIKKQFYDINY